MSQAKHDVTFPRFKFDRGIFSEGLAIGLPVSVTDNRAVRSMNLSERDELFVSLLFSITTVGGSTLKPVASCHPSLLLLLSKHDGVERVTIECLQADGSPARLLQGTKSQSDFQRFLKEVFFQWSRLCVRLAIDDEALFFNRRWTSQLDMHPADLILGIARKVPGGNGDRCVGKLWLFPLRIL